LHFWHKARLFSFKAIIGFLFLVLLFKVSIAQQIPTGKFPVTHLRFNEDTSKLQFAIISDIWGGNRPGVFEDAIEKLELLQPQFVISVGDLIDGKTYDPKLIKRQWDEFDAAIKPLEMPFFYVPGNHDIGNAIMEAEWRKRMGSPYYHFVYKNVLFLCINTEDGGKGGIKDEQVSYFKKVITENTNVRWTFLFMHRPVWQGNGDKQEGYENIERLLSGRNYFLFSGHHHTYLSVTKNGNKHFVLGSTGGGSDLRGEKFGEFDHITLVTLTRGEPKVVNLKLDGIIKEDIVNEQTHPITETLIEQNWFVPIAFVADHQMEKSIGAEIAFKNPTNYPLEITGDWGIIDSNYQIIPKEIKVTIPPQTEMIQKINILKKDNSTIDLATLPFLDISLTGKYIYNKTIYSIAASKKLLFSWKLIPPAKENETNNPYLYHDRDTSGMIYLKDPEYLSGPWYWSGAADGLMRFKMVKEDNFLYVLAIVNDDQWVNDKDPAKDILYLHLEDPNRVKHVISLSPWDDKFSIDGKGSIRANDIGFRKFFTDDLLMMEFKIPIEKVLKNDNTLRMNIGFRDQDNTPEKWVSTLFWKPLWGSKFDYKNSGTFILK